MLRRFFRIAGAASALVLGACATTTTERLGLPPPSTVSHVDLQRYLGTWFEIARFENRFQKGCSETTATYASAGERKLEVINRCLKDGEVDEARGRARVADPNTQSKLEVSFFGPFWGDYWIVALDEDYRWALVGSPTRDYLWILSRTPQLDAGTFDEIVSAAKQQGFETERLLLTPQTGALAPS